MRILGALTVLAVLGTLVTPLLHRVLAMEPSDPQPGSEPPPGPPLAS